MLWGVGRVFMAENCRSRIWGFTSGCVQLPTDESDLFQVEMLGHHVDGAVAMITVYALAPLLALTLFAWPLIGILRCAAVRAPLADHSQHDRDFYSGSSDNEETQPLFRFLHCCNDVEAHATPEEN